MNLKLMYITNDLNVALIAQRYGVDRIWIDLETIGKEERQKGIDTVKSQHSIEDIKKIKPHLSYSEMLVRINKWYEGSKREIDDVISAGANIIMLPYWKTTEEVDNFIKAVGGRCKTVLLLETKEAVECITEVLKQGGFDEIHIGLNDLHLSYKLTFMFELLANGLVEDLCKKFKDAGIPYGFGGIAKIGDGILKSESVIMEHYRLGSSRAILSRSFCDYKKINDYDEIDNIFKNNMETLRNFEKTLENKNQIDFINNKEAVREAVERIVSSIKNNK